MALQNSHQKNMKKKLGKNNFPKRTIKEFIKPIKQKKANCLEEEEKEKN